jgi:hypothetical protein
VAPGPERFTELMPFSVHAGVELITATTDEVVPRSPSRSG